MGEGLDENLRRRVDTLSEKMKQRIQREMVWLLNMRVCWCVYDVVRSLCFSEETCFCGLMTERDIFENRKLL